MVTFGLRMSSRDVCCNSPAFVIAQATLRFAGLLSDARSGAECVGIVTSSVRRIFAKHKIATIGRITAECIGTSGDFNGDGNRDILWRSTSGQVSLWTMNGSTITGGGDLTSGGVAVRPDASWSIAGIGDFNNDGNSDILWRNSSGALNLWLMNGTTITSGGPVTSGGVAVSPDASWHVVQIGDFNGDGNSDILWRNDSGVLSEWLMNGNTITQSVTPTFNGSTVSPDASWSTQAKPTNFG